MRPPPYNTAEDPNRSPHTGPAESTLSLHPGTGIGSFKYLLGGPRAGPTAFRELSLQVGLGVRPYERL